MDPTLLEVLKTLGTVLLAIGGLEGTKAVVSRVRAARVANQLTAEDLMPRSECAIIHSNTTATIAAIKSDVNEIKVALQTLVRIEEKLLALEQAMNDKIELRVGRAISKHISEYHTAHTTGKVPQLDSDDIILK